MGCCSRAGQGSHGGRWAAINAMYADLTGDAQARDDAFRSMNYATYFTSSDGLVACCGADYDAPYWFSDGYADYLRHFNWTMGAMPETAPAGENHLLRSSGVVQEISYGENKIAYKCFGENGTEVLRLKFRPGRVTAGGAALTARKDLKAAGYTVEAVDHGDFVVRVRREGAREAAIEGR